MSSDSKILPSLSARYLSDELLAMHAEAIRFLSADAVERANSGHPGAPMGLAELATALWSGPLRFDPSDAAWSGRDRFILSCGHASMLLYSLAHLWGLGVSREDLMSFRQLGSKTPGHPELGHTPGVEMTTGPLGQGVATSVGVAAAAKLFDARIQAAGGGDDHPWRARKTFVLCSDGDLMEGISSEAAALAGHWALEDLIWLYDDNKISIDGSTALSWSEDVPARFAAAGWRVLSVDGHDLGAIQEIYGRAVESDGRPTLVVCRTEIGRGAPVKAGTSASHGAPLGAEELAGARSARGWTESPFTVPPALKATLANACEARTAARQAWEEARAMWAVQHPEAATLADRLLSGGVDRQELAVTLLAATPAAGATRKLSNAALKAAYAVLPGLVGGSADLSGSNGLSFPEEIGFGDPDKEKSLSPIGRKLFFGIREHAMAGVINGMITQGSCRAFAGTFLVFSDYLRPALRVAALSQIPSAFVLTHDSVFLGEDGPTHQPVEHLWALRLIPGVIDFRPADGVEVAMAWAWLLSQEEHPSFLALSRQGLPALERDPSVSPEQVWRGGYALNEEASPELILMGSGSESALCQRVGQQLKAAGRRVRVVSVPSVNLLQAQDAAYRETLCPRRCPKLVVEAGVTLPWRGIFGCEVEVIGIDRFGASAPADVLATHFGLTESHVLAHAQRILDQR